MIDRHTLLAASVAALPRVAVGQPERPSLTVAVQEIAGTGGLYPPREQSANAGERWIGLILEAPTSPGQQRATQDPPGLAVDRCPIDGCTVRPRLRPGVVMRDGGILTAEAVDFRFGPRMVAPQPGLPADTAAPASPPLFIDLSRCGYGGGSG